ncbi:MAG: glycosyltransferase family 2 protein [Eggerthellaceae bacterium]|nr:glycosyltransferase family 2 protein [Eggerthellaceae bacterium]
MLISIFTPTYNRAYTLGRLYDSIRTQVEYAGETEWIIVDDGSTDETADLVKKWIAENPSEMTIRYFHQKNAGKHAAWNKGLQEALGEIFFPVDSDDYLTPNALHSVEKMVGTVNGSDKIIAVSGTRMFPESKLTGGALLESSTEYIDYSSIDRRSKGISGDLAEAFFTEKLKAYPFPIFSDEHFVPEAVIFNRFSNDGYLIRGFRDPLYCCEYLPDGYTRNVNRLLIKNWKGYTLYIKELMKSPTSPKAKIIPLCGYLYRSLLRAFHIVK